MFTWLSNAWHSFETWVASWLPGVKTMTLTALGALGNVAFLGQDYLTQLTGLNSNVVSGSQIAIASVVLFTLAFWLRGIGDRTKPNVVSTP